MLARAIAGVSVSECWDTHDPGFTYRCVALPAARRERYGGD